MGKKTSSIKHKNYQINDMKTCYSAVNIKKILFVWSKLDRRWKNEQTTNWRKNQRYNKKEYYYHSRKLFSYGIL